MFEYAISFTLQSNTSYQSRYDSLMDAIRNTPDGLPWTETTSFALIRSKETINELADRLYYRTLLSAATDLIIVIDHHSGVAVVRGPVAYPSTLSSHFKQLIKK